MKVISTYRDDIYIFFKLENQEILSFAAWWAFNPWSEAQYHKQLQELLQQVPNQEEQCVSCNKSYPTRFPYQGKFVCCSCNLGLQELREIEFYCNLMENKK